MSDDPFKCPKCGASTRYDKKVWNSFLCMDCYQITMKRLIDEESRKEATQEEFLKDES